MGDFRLMHHGSIAILTPLNKAAALWIEDHVDDPIRWGQNGIAIECNYVAPIVEGITADGFELVSGTVH